MQPQSLEVWASMEQLKSVKERYKEYLLKIPGVTGVGLNGSIIIYVETLTPELKELLPKTLEGFPVKVKVVGRIRMMQSRTDRWRPAPGGVSIGHPKVTAGTLGCRVLKDDEVFGLSNNHVIALDWGTKHIGKRGDSILQPGPYDGGVEPRDKIGELHSWVPVKLEEPNLVDAAIFTSELLKSEVLEVGVPLGSIKPTVGMKVLKSGRTTGITYGKITDVNATVKVEGYGTCVFEDQVVVEPAFAKGGDSGSWCGRTDDWATVGLCFAGSDVISVVCKGLNIERLLGVKIVPPMPSPKAVSTALAVVPPLISGFFALFSTRRRGFAS